MSYPSSQWKERCTTESELHSFTILCLSHWRSVQWSCPTSLSRRVCTAALCIGVLVWSSMLVCLASFLLCVLANLNSGCMYHFAVCCLLHSSSSRSPLCLIKCQSWLWLPVCSLLPVAVTVIYGSHCACEQRLMVCCSDELLCDFPCHPLTCNEHGGLWCML